MQSIIASYKQFNTTYLNGFDSRRISADPYLLALYRARMFNRRGYVANIEEVATLYHLPHTSVETPNIVWANTKTAEPPSNLPVTTGQSEIDEQIRCAVEGGQPSAITPPQGLPAAGSPVRNCS